MNNETTHDDAELLLPDHGAFRSGARSRCWPLPSDSEEAQLALPDGEPGPGDEAAPAGAGHARRRPLRTDRRVRAVLPPLPLEPAGEPADVAMRAFDEQRAASLACAEPGAPGQRTAYECIAAIFAADRTAA